MPERRNQTNRAKTPENLLKKDINLGKLYKISTDIVLTTGLIANFDPGVVNTVGFFGNMALNSVTGQSYSHPRTYETSKWDSATRGESVSKECSSNLKYTDYDYMIKGGGLDQMRAERDAGRGIMLDDIMLNCMMDEVKLGRQTYLFDKVKNTNSLEELDKIYLDYFTGLNAVTPFDHGAYSRRFEPNNQISITSDPNKKAGTRDNPLDLLSISSKYFGRVSNNLNASSRMPDVWPGFFSSGFDTSFLIYKKFLTKVYNEDFNPSSKTNNSIRETYKQKYKSLRDAELNPQSDQSKKLKELADKLTNLWNSKPEPGTKTSVYLNKLKQQYKVSGIDSQAGKQLVQAFRTCLKTQLIFY